MKGQIKKKIIKLAGTLFFLSACIYIIFTIFLISSAIFEKNGDFTNTFPWTILSLILEAVNKALPNLIKGITPSSVPKSWSSFSYVHAIGSFILVLFSIFILRVRRGLYKEQKEFKIIATVLSSFFAMFWLFLLILWRSPLVFFISLLMVSLFSYIAYFLINETFLMELEPEISNSNSKN